MHGKGKLNYELPVTNYDMRLPVTQVMIWGIKKGLLAGRPCYKSGIADVTGQ